MKKIILILLLALFSFSMNAQTVLKKSVTDEYIMVESVDTIDTTPIFICETVLKGENLHVMVKIDYGNEPVAMAFFQFGDYDEGFGKVNRDIFKEVTKHSFITQHIKGNVQILTEPVPLMSKEQSEFIANVLHGYALTYWPKMAK